MSDYHVLDLFCGLGGFSSAFADSERWDVTTVDINTEFEPDICADVFDLRPSDLGAYDVILASPPCQEFSTANNLNGRREPDPEAVLLVYHTIGLIRSLTPRYWFLENPRGRLRSIIGQPTSEVTYCRYGADYMKPTDLWGVHPLVPFRSCGYGDSCHEHNREGTNNYDGDPAEKAKVPYDLSEAIRDACEAALDGTAPKQSTLAEVTP